MKNDKKVFILIETFLAVMILVMALFVLQENTEKNMDKISVIVQNSDDNQWSAFTYGLKMAAEDYGVDLFIVSTGAEMTATEEKSLIENEIKNGAEAVIVQPVPGDDTEKMLKKINSRIPLMLVEHTAAGGKEASVIPTTEPDHYDMGAVLAEELLKDYNGSLDGKALGIVSGTGYSEAAVNREKGFLDGIKDAGAKISWSVTRAAGEDWAKTLENMPRVDIVAALDDDSLTMAGAVSAANDLHGAIVYGIGNSTEAVYYLDSGFAECLVVPDEFNVGYQSLSELAKSLGHFRKAQNQTVSHTVLRRANLFLKENQEILFTMSQ